jgi:hypothetical protein
MSAWVWLGACAILGTIVRGPAEDNDTYGTIAAAVWRRRILGSSVKSLICRGASVLLCAAMLVSSQPALTQFRQQGPKLVGTGAVGMPVAQGDSVALSSDGSTAIVGGPGDNGSLGAVWVYTRSGGAWSQQGSKLVGTGAVGAAQQGSFVAVSADGNTAIVGGPFDNGTIGAVWVYTRSGGVWSQQGSKLVGTGAVGNASQGISVALSGDGNTAIVGGYSDNSGVGAAWVFTRNGGVWTQYGNKLVGAYGGGAEQGWSVALSSDGNTAIVGGPLDYRNVCGSNYRQYYYHGAAWVFTRYNGVWSEQGGKLVGTGAVGGAEQGRSVTLSAYGNTAIVGGPFDGGSSYYCGIKTYTGAAWVFTRSGGVWSQQGSKLVGTGAGGVARQGTSVALSSDGSTAIVGGPGDNGSLGAAWVFVQPLE